MKNGHHRVFQETSMKYVSRYIYSYTICKCKRSICIIYVMAVADAYTCVYTCHMYYIAHTRINSYKYNVGFGFLPLSLYYVYIPTATTVARNLSKKPKRKRESKRNTTTKKIYITYSIYGIGYTNSCKRKKRFFFFFIVAPSLGSFA